MNSQDLPERGSRDRFGQIARETRFAHPVTTGEGMVFSERNQAEIFTSATLAKPSHDIAGAHIRKIQGNQYNCRTEIPRRLQSACTAKRRFRKPVSETSQQAHQRLGRPLLVCDENSCLCPESGADRGPGWLQQ